MRRVLALVAGILALLPLAYAGSDATFRGTSGNAGVSLLSAVDFAVGTLYRYDPTQVGAASWTSVSAGNLHTY